MSLKFLFKLLFTADNDYGANDDHIYQTGSSGKHGDEKGVFRWPEFLMILTC